MSEPATSVATEVDSVLDLSRLFQEVGEKEMRDQQKMATSSNGVPGSKEGETMDSANNGRGSTTTGSLHFVTT